MHQQDEEESEVAADARMLWADLKRRPGMLIHLTAEKLNELVRAIRQQRK